MADQELVADPGRCYARRLRVSEMSGEASDREGLLWPSLHLPQQGSVVGPHERSLRDELSVRNGNRANEADGVDRVNGADRADRVDGVYRAACARLGLIGGLLGVGLALGAVACGPVQSTVVLVDAAAELAAAKAARAEMTAPFELAAADQYLRKAREEQSRADFEVSVRLARRARDCARVARANALASSTSGGHEAEPRPQWVGGMRDPDPSCRPGLVGDATIGPPMPVPTGTRTGTVSTSATPSSSTAARPMETRSTER